MIVEEKLKEIKMEKNSKNLKKYERKKFDETNSNSDTSYEVPIESSIKSKPAKSVDDLNAASTTLRSHSRKLSYPFSESEFLLEDEGKINLPFYIAPLERNSTMPTVKKKDDKNNGENSDLKIKETIKRGGALINFNETDFDSPLYDENVQQTRKNNKIFNFSLKSAMGIREENLKKGKTEVKNSSEETQVKELMFEPETENGKPNKKRFSLPWTKENEKKESPMGKNRKSNESDDAYVKSPKNFQIKVPRLSWKKKKTETGDPKNAEKSSSEEMHENDKNQDENKNDNDTFQIVENRNPDPEESKKFSGFSDLINLKGEESFEQPRAVFLEDNLPLYDAQPINFFVEKEEEEEEERESTEKSNEQFYFKKEHLYKSTNPFYSSDFTRSKERRQRYKGKIDPNPLKNMFKTKVGKPFKESNLRIEGEDEKSLEETPEKKETEIINISWNKPENFTENEQQFTKKWSWQNFPRFQVSEIYAETDGSSHTITSQDGVLKLTTGGFGDPVSQESLHESVGSDTESADHGSTDKSSMSKLTSEKQPKKLMSGLFGSFRKGKNKDRVGNNETGINASSFEVMVKEPSDEVHIVDEQMKPEGIVYAELDMAKSPASVMRRDEGEKTEYAEIIYPTGKITSERATNELRKSRENLFSSRENLAEREELPFTTIITPDGKKEAAV